MVQEGKLEFRAGIEKEGNIYINSLQGFLYYNAINFYSIPDIPEISNKLSLLEY